MVVTKYSLKTLGNMGVIVIVKSSEQGSFWTIRYPLKQTFLLHSKCAVIILAIICVQ